MFATDAMAIDVASQTDWNTAVAAVAAAGAGTTTVINVTNGFTLTSSLAQLQASNANVTVNITGNGQSIDGAAAFQGIQVNGANALTVNISNLTIANTTVLGGNGGIGQNGFFSSGLSYGSGGGGGGGRGSGGGLFVGGGANVTVASVTFTGNSATGGVGGNGGAAQNTASSPTGGNGGDGGALNGGGSVGGGGPGGLGGNTGTQGTAGANATTDGAGGGGGGGSGTLNATAYTPNNQGGNGNAGGGNGRAGGDGVTNNNGTDGPGADGGTGGNGGSGQGGAIYVATGGTLTVLDAPISGVSVTGGAAGSSGVGQGPNSINGGAGTAGTGQGGAIYLNGVRANIGVSGGGTVVYGDTIGGTGLTVGSVNTALNKTGTGMLTLSATNTFTGNVNISAGTLSVGTTANLGNVANDVVILDGATLRVTATTTFANGRAFSLSGMSAFDIAGGTTSTLQGVISDGTSAGSLDKVDTGTLVLSGTNTYTGATFVEGGTLRLGSATALPSAGPVVAATGGTLDLNGFNHTFNSLSGGGTVTGANTTIGASGRFSPGDGTPASSMAIVGNLSFDPGATFAVQVNPATASLAAVTGTATLNGATANATYAPGTYVSKKYTILTATGGVTGTFGQLTSADLPANVTSSLSYDANDVFLDLVLNFGGNRGSNQTNVANALSAYFDRNGGIPAVYADLTPAGLTQASGEVGTGSQQTTFNAMGLFLGVLTDPSISNRGTPMVTAPLEEPIDADVTGSIGRSAGRAVSMKDEGMPALASPYLDRWRVWASGFGGSQRADGDAAQGSNDQTAYTYGLASGVDYKVSPNIVAGIGLAGTGTNFSVSDGLGRGHSDMVQAGAFARYDEGPVYLTGAVAYGRPDITTDRTVTIAGIDELHSDFSANALSGRLESGYHIPTPWWGVTPFAAAEFTTAYLPGYDEQVVSGSNAFALSYESDDITASRTELGVRTDKAFPVDDAILTLRGRMAWAHNFNTDRSATAVFQALAGASFEVNGAAQASNALLTSASAELTWQNGFSVGGTFDSEYAGDARSVSGKGVLKYQW